MKKLSILLISLVFFSCGGSKSNPDDAVKSIKFQFTELGRETMFRITCDRFIGYFPESKVKNFSTKPAIDSVMQILTGMKPINDGTLPDVRGKIYITHVNNSVDTLCVGVKVLNYKDAIYETPQDLLRLVQK